MQLTERHIIKYGHQYYDECNSLTFDSKNLYNFANYMIRQRFINSSKAKESGLVEHASWLRYEQIQGILQQIKHENYYNLPTKVSQQILRLLDKSWKSFFQAVKAWKRTPGLFTGRPALPGYLEKIDGRFPVVYTTQAISFKDSENGILKLSGTNIYVHTLKQNIKQIRIIPKDRRFVIEIVYEQEVQNLNLDPLNIAGIDMGVGNLAAITSNQRGFQPIVVNGRGLKSINQFYNKIRSKLMAFLGEHKTSRRLTKLTNKRNNIMESVLHKASRQIVNYLILNNMGSLVIGKNDGWKQECNMSKKNNQNFVSIPHAKFIQMITYKCELVGIDVYLNEESFTSKCSFLDMESLEHHDKYLGRRVKRGLFVSSNGTKINADCNGSGNIIRKVFPNAFANGIEGVVVPPVRISPHKQNCLVL